MNRPTRPKPWTPAPGGKQGGGYFSYDYGHLLLWMWWGNPEDRPLFERKAELEAQFGSKKAEFMVGASRNLCLYPNVYLMDQFSSQIRHFRPISVDQTEVTIYCIAPKGEERRSAQQPHPSVRGLLQCQRYGHPGRSRRVPFLPEDLPGSRRPVERPQPWCHTPDSRVRTTSRRDLGMNRVLSSGAKTEDEGLYPIQHGYWRDAMLAAVDAEQAASNRTI